MTCVGLGQYYKNKFKLNNTTAEEGRKQCTSTGGCGETVDCGMVSEALICHRRREVLDMSSGIEEGASEFKWHLVLCLLLGWVIIFFCLIKGIKSSGKVCDDDDDDVDTDTDDDDDDDDHYYVVKACEQDASYKQQIITYNISY